jgi:hypothetical protein
MIPMGIHGPKKKPPRDSVSSYLITSILLVFLVCITYSVHTGNEKLMLGAHTLPREYLAHLIFVSYVAGIIGAFALVALLHTVVTGQFLGRFLDSRFVRRIQRWREEKKTVTFLSRVGSSKEKTRREINYIDSPVKVSRGQQEKPEDE